MTEKTKILRSRTGLRQNQAGTVAVEFALVMPFLLLIMIGVADFGRAFSHRMDMEAAARAGLQLAVVNSSSSTTAMTQIKTVLEETLGNPGNLTWSLTYTVECTGGNQTLTAITADNIGTPPAIECSDGSAGTGRWIEVAVSQPFSPIFTLYGFDKVLNLSGNAYGRIQ